MRRVQALRKEADFDIDDHIVTYYLGSPEVEEVFEDEAEYIMAETLSVEIVKGDAPEGSHVRDYLIDGVSVRLGVAKRQSG